jgi:glycosidase
MFIGLAAGSIAQGAETTHGRPESTVEHPSWSRNVGIYEVNVRQYTPSGTFAEFEQHLPRLKELGVGILWFMPIHPIGEKNRKGTLGSYYSVKDYMAVNPEFGTFQEFKALVEKIHAMDMYVIIDWVANHTAWDNPLTVEHPEWYMQDSDGNFYPPVADWSDVIDLNYDNPELRRYVIDAMKFWVEEADIDGFRCDVAGMVPLDFWEDARAELEEIKPVFLLAEWDGGDLHTKAFDMSYDWDLYEVMKAIASSERRGRAIDAYLILEKAEYPEDAYRMRFTSNHDENSWSGSSFDILGSSAETFGVLTCVFPGMPLVYSGQEAGLDRKLSFFEKDEIEWRKHKMGEIYELLLNLKKKNKALWNGVAGGEMVRVNTSNDNDVFAFVREKNDDKIFAVFNLSDWKQGIKLVGDDFVDEYTDVFTGEKVSFAKRHNMRLVPWEYRVYVK